jgi:uncharacterized protein (TIGR03083 family)
MAAQAGRSRLPEVTMSQLSRDRYFTTIAQGTDQLAEIVAEHDPGLPIPTCPEWSLRQLATHVGRVHRWVAEMTGTRSAQAIPFRQVPDGRYPGDHAEQAAWLRAGARRVIDAVQAAGEDPVWTFAGSGPASLWARRMAHETLVHRVDAQLAAGAEPDIDPVLAADAIDEFLGLLIGRGHQSSDPAVHALPAGAIMHLHASDDGLDGTGEWLVRQGTDGISVEPGHGKGDVAVAGPAAGLLLMLVRRRPAAGKDLTVYGKHELLSGWLDGTPY